MFRRALQRSPFLSRCIAHAHYNSKQLTGSIGNSGQKAEPISFSNGPSVRFRAAPWPNTGNPKLLQTAPYQRLTPRNVGTPSGENTPLYTQSPRPQERRASILSQIAILSTSIPTFRGDDELVARSVVAERTSKCLGKSDGPCRLSRLLVVISR